MRLPLWLLKYSTPLGRQHKQWSFRQAFSIRLFFSAVYHIANVQLKTALPLTPGKEKERFIVIDAAASKYYKGPLAPTSTVKPIQIGGSWYPAPLTPSSETSSLTVVLHLHGGAFVLGDGRTQASGYFVSKMLKHGGATHVFCPQYRLSTLPPSATSNPFPAALQDSVTSYLYLINELKISPKNIILSGDSAGANLAIALLRYISEYGADLDLPAPSAAWLWSPWVQPTESVDPKNLTQNPHYGSDYLSYSFTEWGAYSYAGKNVGDAEAAVAFLSSPYISHKDHPFRTETPIWLTTGGAEVRSHSSFMLTIVNNQQVLYFDDVKWAGMMRDVIGNRIELDVEETAPHDVCLIGAQLGFDKEATACAKRAGEWARGVRK
jgi:acetyl esterase/lipase